LSTTSRAHLVLSLLVPGVILAALLQACRPAETPLLAVPSGAKAGDLVDLAACTYKAGEVSFQADCGTLVVPENRSNSQSRLIALPVIRVRAQTSSPGSPIFFLQGGPGGTNQEFQFLEGLNKDRDFIQVGYRGVDGSVVLDCTEIADAIRSTPGELLSDAALESYSQASARCASRLEAGGVDLASYTMTDVIEDMEAARRALGYDRINLLGESYGTRLEMIYEWAHPASLERAIMIAVNPPGHFVWSPDAVDAQLGDYAKLCAQDAACSARTADLLASMRRVSENMPKRWLFFPIDAGAVKILTFVLFAESVQPQGPPVPLNAPAAIDLWLDAEHGDYSGMALMTMTRNQFLPDLFVWGDLFSKGGSGGDFDGRATDPPSVLYPAGSILGSPFSLLHWAMMRGWPVHLVPEQYRQLQSSDVETLLVSGNVDFATPPQYATQELLPDLTRGTQVLLSDFGHTETFWTSQPEARTNLLNTFFSTGQVDDSLYKHQLVNFQPDLTWGRMAKMAATVVLLILVILAVVVWLIVRRARRRARMYR
jgi:pimeloyl-ACP methyl ester carboxylesterase